MSTINTKFKLLKLVDINHEIAFSMHLIYLTSPKLTKLYQLLVNDKSSVYTQECPSSTMFLFLQFILSETYGSSLIHSCCVYVLLHYAINPIMRPRLGMLCVSYVLFEWACFGGWGGGVTDLT